MIARLRSAAPVLFLTVLLSASGWANGHKMAGGTADRVRVDVRLSEHTLSLDKQTRLEVTLRIDSGWHVIANPPSLDFLIPTTVDAGLRDAQLRFIPRYPPADKEIDVGLEKAIAVYDNGVRIPSALTPVQLPAGQPRGKMAVSVRAQACNDAGICLPPATLRAEIPVRFSVK